jgi:hypothetical protein
MATRRWTPSYGILKPSGAVRPITDLRLFNQVTTAPGFKYESLPTLRSTIELHPELKWAAKLDMKDWFYNVALKQSVSRWIRIRVQKGTSYEVTCMPFGLSSAPYWSSQLAAPLVAHLRDTMKYHLIWYVDDVLLLARSKEEMERAIIYVIGLLTSCGIVVNSAKCSLIPSSAVEFLGIQLNMELPGFEVPANKRVKILMSIQKLLGRARIPPKVLAHIAGSVQYLVIADVGLQGWAKVLSRAAARMAARNRWWSKPRTIHPVATLALTKIREALMHPHPRVILTQKPLRHWCLTTDASDSGWGAVAQTPSRRPLQFWGHWNPSQSNLHITAKEALATQLGLESLEATVNIQGCSVLIRTDSVATKAALIKGSARVAVNGPTSRVATRLNDLACALHAVWICSAANNADGLSRKKNAEDYRLVPQLFRRALRELKVPAPRVDMFASRHNACAAMYFSERQDGGTGLQGLDSLAADWSELRGPLWVNPPFSLMAKVLAKIRRERPRGSVIVLAPVWRSASWWPILEQMTVREFRVPKGVPVYVRRGHQLLPPPRWQTTIRLLRLSA